MKFFHLSHTDLDGYSCQLITQKYFSDGLFLNANYGMEVKSSIKKILNTIINYKEEEILIFITDLNLTLNESKDLDKNINKLKKDGFNIKLQLLDHHATGLKSSNIYDWYYLDTKRSASKIVFDYMLEEFDDFEEKIDSSLEPLIDCVNAIDIWLEEQTSNFEFGKVLLTMISKVREINSILFPDLNRKFRLYLLDEASNYLNLENRAIELDNDIHLLKKKFLMTNGIDDTLDNLSAKYLVNSLDYLKDELTIYYKDYKGLLTYTLGSISIPANAFLKANKDYDFFIDISRKGNASFRADGKVDVSIMAEKLANGGGHVNAAGARFDDFKENIDYQVIKTYIQKKLDNL